MVIHAETALNTKNKHKSTRSGERVLQKSDFGVHIHFDGFEIGK